MFRSVFAGVSARPLLVVLAAVFAGLAMLLGVSAVVTAQPLVLLAAVPLALTAGLMWYQGTGRLARSMFGRGRRGRRRPGSVGSVSEATGSTDGGQDREGGRDGSFRETARRAARHQARRQARRRARHESEDDTASERWQRRNERPDRLGGLTRAEAYEVLGLDPTASDEEVREAYRERAKTAHPDTDGGSVDEFQQLNDAYERIIEE